MKRISLEKIEQQYSVTSYQKLYEKVLKLLEEGKIKPVKKNGTNGKKPALYKEYWLIEEKEDNSSFLEELSYEYVPVISTDYYLCHLKQYKEDRFFVLLLNQYLKTNREELKTRQSMNERSFAIWKREKFLKEEQGLKILKRCGIPMDMLNLYSTTEPLAYYVHSRKTPQNLLIIENKDTFYSMRKHLMLKEEQIMGLSIGTLIYGAGKGILRSFEDYTFAVEPFMRAEENKIYYFGDLDYEGIGIYEDLAELFKMNCKIEPFCAAYEKMLLKAASMGAETMPKMKEGQKKREKSRFWDFFENKQVENMKRILDMGCYIPQEILNINDF